jgi:hypothetical protein
MNEPRILRAGDVSTWSESFAEFPATSGWTLSYRLLGAINYSAVNAVANGDGFDVTFSSSETSKYSPADYLLVGYVAKGAERHTISETSITVKGDVLTEAGGGDTRSHARRTLALIEAAIESYASRPVDEITIAGRTVRRPSLAALLSFRSRYQYFVKQEEMKERADKGADPGGSVLWKFGGVR